MWGMWKSKDEMIRNDLIRRGISDPRVIRAFEEVDRVDFVESGYESAAYADGPQPIGFGQTISQPLMVGLMSQQLDLHPGMTVLEIGTGSGYQAAILENMGGIVYSIERIRELYDRAKERLDNLGYKVKCFHGDGTKGLPEFGPYDRIICTAAAPECASLKLVEQLKEEGKLLIPEGDSRFIQVLKHYDKKNGKVHITSTDGCVFVPLIGEFGFENERELI
eukprot:TRINITY_DN10181_c0_g1_i1.p1 TRINITY_DN10181_c0_g1~~TRINITY_DN10181_c0_g1_i1.p1  ORF type:complete len:221 (-),score=67.02 TRINITY_DN10181_c0_g1_i1:485-1147(-)